MAPLPLEVPPGIVKTKSANAAKGRYTDCDKVRFVNGQPEKWAGWIRFIEDILIGVARGAVAWTNQYGNVNAAFGTHLKLFVVTGNDALADITPIRATGTINNNPFAMTDTLTLVTVTDTAHGADDGAFVEFSGASAAGGITIDGEYQLTKIDADSYTINHSSPATSTTTGGGASVMADYQINPGTADAVVGTGWGAGTWGSGTWGTPRTDGIGLELRTWSVFEYGNDLMASPSLGSLYLWEEETDARAELVTDAPAEIRASFVSSERFVFALGTSTPMTVQWPDQDDITDWVPSSSNTANIRTLQAGSKLMAGTTLVDGVSLVWSDTALYVFQYTGSDFIYDSRLAGTACGLAAPLGFTKVSGIAFWLSGQDFHMYAGGVQMIPNSQDVSDYVFRDMDPALISKTWCEYDQKNNQVRWHYCANGSNEPNKYVDVSLDGNFTWTTGTWSKPRTTGTLFRPSDASSLLVDQSGIIYQHNVGLDDEEDPLEAHITFGEYAIARGEKNVDVMGIIPDCERQVGNLDYEIYTKERPNSTAHFDEQTVTIAPGVEIEDARVCGRHFGMTVRSNELGGDFRLGIVNLEVQPSGDRR